MSAIRRIVVPAVLFILAGFEAGYAQVQRPVFLPSREIPRRGSTEVGGGLLWGGGFDTGRSTAQLTRSGQQPRYDLFNSDGSVSGFPGAHLRVGMFVSRQISVEAGLRYARPELAYRLTGDVESAPDETAVESIHHYVFDGSMLYHFTQAAFAGGRGVPFVSGGAGYVRELHQGNELIETGNEIHATGGVKYWFGTRGRRFGLRAEAGLSSRQKGFDRREGRRTLPFVLAGLTFVY